MADENKAVGMEVVTAEEKGPQLSVDVEAEPTEESLVLVNLRHVVRRRNVLLGKIARLEGHKANIEQALARLKTELIELDSLIPPAKGGG